MKTTGVLPEALAARISWFSRSEIDIVTNSFRLVMVDLFKLSTERRRPAVRWTERCSRAGTHQAHQDVSFESVAFEQPVFAVEVDDLRQQRPELVRNIDEPRLPQRAQDVGLGPLHRGTSFSVVGGGGLIAEPRGRWNSGGRGGCLGR